jgi:hypothetical protein
MAPPLCRIDPLEQQLELWLRLAGALEQAQRALLSGDVTGFERFTEIQAECCRQYRGLGSGEAGIFVREPGMKPTLLAEIQQAQRRVRHLNQVHAALLQRASRSLRILRNLITSPAVPYQPATLPDGKYLPAPKG